MFRCFIFIILASFATSALAIHCDTSVIVSAEYTRSLHSAGKLVRQGNIKLWRNREMVAIENRHTQITEIWEQTKNQPLRLTRYFDAHLRGIEYQPNEINAGKGETDWSLKRQLISDGLIKKMTLLESKGGGCKLEQTFHYKTSNTEMMLVWLPHQKLVKRFQKLTPTATQRWGLVAVNKSSSDIAKFFKERSDYYLTDYADIGDNESDPFFVNMINLGFVEHGSTGFYNASGDRIEGGHRHAGH